MKSLIVPALLSLAVLVHVTSGQFDDDFPPIIPKTCYDTCAEEHASCVKVACEMMAVHREQWCHDGCLYLQTVCFDNC
ncbi:hypothetical protein LSAT2_003478 [Lamellibrachia satsuma]|nr:hypothetical protein LSAT2_003478 [Lamellibrachia satsuma]